MAKKSSHAVELDPSMRIVVLHGKERFLIEEHTRRLIEMLDEKFGGVEVFHFDGETVQPATVLDELRSYGLMQKHKLVTLEKADLFLAGKKGASEDEQEGDGDASASGTASSDGGTRRPLIERYAENPVPDATLLLRAATWRPGKLDKLIAKVGSVNECNPPSEGKAISWCVARCQKRYGATLNPDAAELLVSRLGPQLQRLDTEMMKLSAMAGAGSNPAIITRELVGQAVGLSREEKAWELQSVVVTGDAAAMLRKLNEQLRISPQQPSSTIIPMSWAIIDLLRKSYAASQLLSRGLPSGAVRSQLKLWGDTTEPILGLAARIKPEIFAQLLRLAIETDVCNKSGVGDPVRNLEALMVRIADELALGMMPDIRRERPMSHV